MVHFRKLAQNGSSTAITIPQSYLGHLGWRRGDTIVEELMEDGTIWVRRPNARDFANLTRNIPDGNLLPPVAR